MPVGVFTEKERWPVAAPLVIVIVTGTLVEVPPVPIVALNPVPAKTTDVRFVRFVPVIVAVTDVP